MKIKSEHVKFPVGLYAGSSYTVPRTLSLAGYFEPGCIYSIRGMRYAAFCADRGDDFLIPWKKLLERHPEIFEHEPDRMTRKRTSILWRGHVLHEPNGRPVHSPRLFGHFVEEIQTDPDNGEAYALFVPDSTSCREYRNTPAIVSQRISDVRKYNPAAIVPG